LLRDVLSKIPLYTNNRYPDWAYFLLWDAQNGECLGCHLQLQNPRGAVYRGKNWGWIDHDHVTGKVRGLLCGSCNRKDVLAKKEVF